MTWQESAAARIEEIGKTFPADMPLKEMRQILSAAGADFAGGTSWPHKAWRKAQRAYLERASVGERPEATHEIIG